MSNVLKETEQLTYWFKKYKDLEKKCETLYQKIKHGDTDHMNWLLRELEEHLGVRQK